MQAIQPVESDPSGENKMLERRREISNYQED